MAAMIIIKSCHPTPAILHSLNCFHHLSLKSVRQLLCGAQKENRPFRPKFVIDPQKWQFRDLTNRVRFPQTPPFVDASSIKEIMPLAFLLERGWAPNKARQLTSFESCLLCRPSGEALHHVKVECKNLVCISVSITLLNINELSNHQEDQKF